MAGRASNPLTHRLNKYEENLDDIKLYPLPVRGAFQRNGHFNEFDAPSISPRRENLD